MTFIAMFCLGWGEGGKGGRRGEGEGDGEERGEGGLSPLQA